MGRSLSYSEAALGWLPWVVLAHRCARVGVRALDHQKPGKLGFRQVRKAR
jgi:hypothetical protein